MNGPVRGVEAPPPTIVHLDADAFFVSCEQARDPSLRGKKCAVGGRERGIISSASYEARACGVYTPMPTARALKVCPDLIMIRHTSGLYGAVSRRMFDLCEAVTPIVQRNSVDEGYLDVAPCGWRSAGEIETAMRALQQRIWDELEIPVSIGIAANKLVAQIASKLRKPRGFVVVQPGAEAEFLAPLPIGKLPGVGVKTEAALTARGLRLVRDLFEREEGELESIFGGDWRGMLARARGEDDRPVATDEDDAKSYSQQETFPADVADFARIETVAKGMLDELMAKVRADGKHVRTLTVKVRYPDFPEWGFASADAFHVKIEAQKLAYADLYRYNADPRFAKVPAEGLISKDYATERAGSIDLKRARCEVRPGDPSRFGSGKDTIYLSVVDRDGNIVSLIQSLYSAWGSGVVVDDYGFALQNRGALFTLDPRHPDVLAPHKRPFHTIIPAFMERGDLHIGFGIMGGANQAQAHAQFVSDVVDYGMNIQAALEAPRFTKPQPEGCGLSIEDRVPAAVRESLRDRGHQLDVRGDFSSEMGGGQAVLHDSSSGVNYGASDPRKDGAAVPEPDPYFTATSP